MMLAYNTTVHTSTGYTPYRLVFGDECNLPGNLVHRELRADPPPGDPGTYASWVQQALYEAYDEVCAQQQRATHRQKRNYDSKAVARAFPIGCWTLRYYPPARKNKLCSPWIGPYKVVRAPMEWVVGIQLDARIIYVHMDDLKRCAPPDPEPTWPDAARGTSVVVSTRSPSTLARSDVIRSQHTPGNTSHPRGSAHHPKSAISGHADLRAPTLPVLRSGVHHPISVISGHTDLHAPTLPVLRSGAHHPKSTLSGQIDVRAPTSEEFEVITDTDGNSIVKTYAVPSSTWNLQDENCILSMKSNCSIDVKGYRFFTMERLFYALQLLSLGDRKFIGQLAKYSRMDYVRKCVNTRFEMASSTLQNKWLDEQFQRLYQHAFCQTQLLNKHSLTRLAHLYLTLRSRCMLQRLRQQEKCVYKERCCVGLHGSHSPRESHVGRLLSDWPSGHCIVTRNVSCRAAMATSPCCDKVHCPGVTSWSVFTEIRRF